MAWPYRSTAAIKFPTLYISLPFSFNRCTGRLTAESSMDIQGKARLWLWQNGLEERR